MKTITKEKIKSESLEEVWEWKEKLSDALRGKSFEEVKKILDAGMIEYRNVAKESE